MNNKKKITINFNLGKRKEEAVFSKIKDFANTEGFSDSQGVIEYIWLLIDRIKKSEEEVFRLQQARSFLEAFKDQFISQNQTYIKTLEDTKDGLKELRENIAQLRIWNGSY